MVTIVLLKEAWMCTTPNETCLRSFFLNVFFLPFFSGAAAPAAAAGFAMKTPSLAVGRWSLAESHIPNDHVFQQQLKLKLASNFTCIVAAGFGQRPKTNSQQLLLRFCRRLLLLCDR